MTMTNSSAHTQKKKMCKRASTHTYLYATEDNEQVVEHQDTVINSHKTKQPNTRTQQ